MSKNDITGDEIKSKISTKEWGENYDNIFRKRIVSNPMARPETPPAEPLECPNYPDACFCTGACNKQREKAIAQNGNVGYSVDDIYQIVEKDYKEKT